MNELLKEASKKGYSQIMIMGDFNYKGIIWKNWSTPGLSNSSEEFLFVAALRDCYLYQHITKWTRIRHGQEPSILDLVITNEEDMTEDIEYLSPHGKSDHIVICFNFICYIQQTNKDKLTYCYEKGNCDAMRTELEHIDWDMELQKRAKEIDMQWIFIKEKVQEMIENQIPTRKIKMKKMKNKYHWGAETTEIIRKKHKAW